MNEWASNIDRDQLAHWLAIRALWLNTIERKSGSQRTRHEYARVWATFYGTAHGYALAPWAVEPGHVYAWAGELSRRLAPASVNKSLSILSSWYKFAMGQRLWRDANPFVSPDLRAHITRYGRSAYPTTDQVRAILGVIDTSSPLGLRDRALYGGMVTTTRRLFEWLELRWGDITGEFFTARIKGGRYTTQVLPTGLLTWIVDWLQAAGNWPPQPAHYIFAVPGRWHRPLNPGYVNRRLHYYGRLAGVPARLCHAHGLRHAGARQRFQQGATLKQLQDILCHRSSATTEIYIRTVLSEPEDQFATSIYDAFFGGLPDARMPNTRASAPVATPFLCHSEDRGG